MTPLEVLQQIFGFASFQRCQQQVIERLMRGEHALVVMPTGSGKSLCYQVPALANWPTEDRSSISTKQPVSVVISPLIALMKDQVDALCTRGVAAAFINSSLTRAEREQRYRDVADGHYDILYVTPERFRKPEFLEVIARRQIRLLAVDEAHCISSWGHDFRPDYTRLAEFRALLGHPTTVALTATATPDVQRDIVYQLGLEPDDVAMFHEGIDRPNLELLVHEVWGVEEKMQQILAEVEGERLASGSGIIYFTLIRTLEHFSVRLTSECVPHSVYHGDLERTRRRQIQERFMKGEEKLVLATCAFGMGIDKEDIRLVLHADLPGSLESYYQEIGRAGRDGRPSRCVLLYDQHDLPTQMEFLRWSNPDADFYYRAYDLLSVEREKIAAFGVEWMRERLHARDKGDRRLDTALAILDRYGVIENDETSEGFTVVGDLPAALQDSERLAEKLLRDQKRLLALVQFARCDGNRREYLQQYFGL